eukprot:727894-Amorphochlora_amoeboformis.AAC.2
MEPKGRKAENEDECPSLQDMVLGLIAEQSDDLKTLLRKNIHHLSEALVLKLLYFTLQKGKLDPDLAATFLSCHHKSVREWIQQRVDMFAYVAITNESDQKSSRVPTGLAKRGLRRAVAPTIVPQTIGTRERVVNLAGREEERQGEKGKAGRGGTRVGVGPEFDAGVKKAENETEEKKGGVLIPALSVNTHPSLSTSDLYIQDSFPEKKSPGYINIKQVTIANGAKSVNGVQLFSAEGLIRSDVDMQLLVTIPFLQAVNLKSFSFDAPAKSEGKKE